MLKLPLSISENYGTDPIGDVLLRKSLQEDSLLLSPPFQRGKAESSDRLHPPLQDYCWMHLANLKSRVGDNRQLEYHLLHNHGRDHQIISVLSGKCLRRLRNRELG